MILAYVILIYWFCYYCLCGRLIYVYGRSYALSMGFRKEFFARRVYLARVFMDWIPTSNSFYTSKSLYFCNCAFKRWFSDHKTWFSWCNSYGVILLDLYIFCGDSNYVMSYKNGLLTYLSSVLIEFYYWELGNSLGVIVSYWS